MFNCSMRCQKQGSDKLSSVHRSQNVHQMIAKHFPKSGNLRLSPGHSDIHTNPQLRFCQKKILFFQLHHLFALSKMSEHSRIRAERALTKWPLPSPLCQLELLQVASTRLVEAGKVPALLCCCAAVLCCCAAVLCCCALLLCSAVVLLCCFALLLCCCAV